MSLSSSSSPINSGFKCPLLEGLGTVLSSYITSNGIGVFLCPLLLYKSIDLKVQKYDKSYKILEDLKKTCLTGAVKTKNKTNKQTNNRAFSHDHMSAILVFQNNQTAAMLVSQTNPVRVEPFSYVKTFFLPLTFYNSWPLEFHSFKQGLSFFSLCCRMMLALGF